METKIHLGLNKIVQNSFKTTEFFKNLSPVIEQEHLSVIYNTKTVVSRTGELIDIVSTVRYSYMSEEVFSLKETFVFYVESLQDYIIIGEDDKDITFKIDIVPTFLNVVYSTMRGIVHEKFKDTILKDFPMPLIPIDLLQKNNVFFVN